LVEYRISALVGRGSTPLKRYTSSVGRLNNRSGLKLDGGNSSIGRTLVCGTNAPAAGEARKLGRAKPPEFLIPTAQRAAGRG
jgi:hypothetical protein